MTRRAAVVLVLLAALHVGLDWRWHAADAGVQYTDAAYHHSRVVDFWKTSDDADERARLEDKQRYGDLGYLAAAGVAAVVGPEPKRLLPALSVLIWPLLMLAGYALGWLLAVERRELAGLLSAALLGLLPGVFNYARVLVLDLPLALAVATAMVGLLRWPDAQGRDRWVAGGLAAAGVVGVLGLKANGLAFVVGPMALLVAPRLDRRGWIAAAAAGLLLGLLLLTGQRGAALWRTLTEATWPGYAWAYADAGTAGSFLPDWAAASRAHVWDAVYYTVLQTFTPPWLLLAAVGGGLWAWRGRHRAAVAAWLLPPAVLLLLVLRGLWDERYIIPMLPAVAAATGAGLASVPKAAPRWGLAAGSVLGAGALFLLISFPALPTLRPQLCRVLPSWGGSERTGDVWTCALYPDYRFLDRATTPEPATPAGEQVLAELGVLSQGVGRPLQAVFLDELYGVFYDVHQRSILGDDALAAGDMILIVACDDPAALTAAHGSEAAARALVEQADVVVVRWNDGAGTAYGRRCGLLADVRDRFELRGAVPLADGTEIRVLLQDREAYSPMQ